MNTIVSPLFTQIIAKPFYIPSPSGVVCSLFEPIRVPNSTDSWLFQALLVLLCPNTISPVSKLLIKGFHDWLIHSLIHTRICRWGKPAHEGYHVIFS